MISPVFGPCLPDYSNPFLEREPDSPPLAVVRIESREVPPVTIVEEMSTREPDLVFELLYSNWASGVRGSRVYRRGDVTSETREAFDIEAECGEASEPAGNQSSCDPWPATCQYSESPESGSENGETPAAAVNGGVGTSRREFVTHCLSRKYALLRKKLFDRCTLTPREEAERGECCAVVNALEQQMDDDDRFYIEQLEEQYDRGMSRYHHQCDLHDRLARCLQELTTPYLDELLDAEDQDTVGRMTRVLRRLSPHGGMA